MDGIEITTERLRMVPLGTQYLQSTADYALDIENTKYMCYFPHRDAAETLEFLENAEREWAKDRPSFLEFAILYEGRHIGAVSVYFEEGAAELGWILNRRYWGNGLAREAAKGLIDCLSMRFGTRYFIAHCDAENTASYKTMEKLGMTRTKADGTRRNRSAREDSIEYRYELQL